MTIHARSSAEIAVVADRVRSAAAVAFDTEFLWERTYHPMVCLLQVAVPGFEATVDPLGDGDVTPLWEALVGGPTVVMHAGAHDLAIVQRHAGRLPEQVFDTQVAAAFLGYGESVGHGNLVQAALKRQVRGGEGYTDWSRRPLTADQQEYALEDVRHLLDLQEALAAALDRKGRNGWAADEMARRFARVVDEVDPDDMWRKVADARKLKGRALAVLQEVTAWREREAMAKDRSRQHVVPDRVLIEVARRAPTDPVQIAGLRGLHPGQAKAVGTPLAAAVKQALQRPEAEWPTWPARPPFGGDPRLDAFASLLNAVVRSRAAEMDIAPTLFGNRGDLEEVARRSLAGELDGGVPLLEGWRRDAVGEQVLAILRGKAAVRVVSDGSGPHLVVE